MGTNIDVTASLARYLDVYGADIYIKSLPESIPQALTDGPTLESARIHLSWNGYNLSLRDTAPGNLGPEDFYREISLSGRQLSAIQFQLEQIHELLGHQVPAISGQATGNQATGGRIVFAVWTRAAPEQSVPAINAINAIFLGIAGLRFLEWQDVDRYRSYFNKPAAADSVKMFNAFVKDPGVDREQIMLISGTVLHSLGTTYTADIDLFTFNVKPCKQLCKPIDAHYVLCENDTVEVYRGPGQPDINGVWLSRYWPAMCNAGGIHEVMHNPEHHYWFLGIRFVSVELTAKRLLSRSSPAGYVDLLMLKQINAVPIEDLCVPNTTLRQGKMTIYDSNELNHLYRTMSKYFREWHGINMPPDEIRKILPRCYDKPFGIYKDIVMSGDDIKPVIRFHNSVKELALTKYKTGDNLLDVGSGYLRDQYAWQKAGYRRAVAIEPSRESFTRGMARKLPWVYFINGLGDVDWTADKKYAAVLRGAPYDVIMFSFTIHYMLNNIDTVINNLKLVSGPNTRVIVTCLDGDLLAELMRESGIYEVRYGQDPTYGIYAANFKPGRPIDEILVYFAGVYGVSRGSFERLMRIGEFITLMDAAGFKAIDNKQFTDFPNTLNEKEAQISRVHKLLVFERQAQVGIAAGPHTGGVATGGLIYTGAGQKKITAAGLIVAIIIPVVIMIILSVGAWLLGKNEYSAPTPIEWATSITQATLQAGLHMLLTIAQDMLDLSI